MARGNGPVHVATIKRRHKGKVYESHLLRRTYREGGHVKHQTLGNISHLPGHIIEMIRAGLKGEAWVPASNALEIVRSLPHGHVAAVLGTLRKLGLEDVIASRPSRERDLVVAMVVERVIDPGSKLAAARALFPETFLSTLGPVLGVEGADEDELYAAMDWLLKRQTRIETKLAGRHLKDGTLVLYDVTSSYYTGTHCPLARFGHSREGRKGFPQIVWGLLCNSEGCPVAVEVFEGNTADPKTLRPQIKKVRRRFGLSRVVFVGDRGMITSARIREELKGVDGLDWITALRAPAIRKLAEAGAIQLSLFDERDLAEATSPDYPNERLIVCRNPLLAEERKRKRKELLQATEKELDKIAAATRRAKRALKGKDRIGVRVGKVLNRYKVGKHFKLTIGEKSFSYERDLEKIAAEAALDGIYVIRTSVPKKSFSAEKAVRAYKDLAAVERAFRSLKTVDLHVRPIHHRLPGRVRAHVFLCMLSYYVEWHMRKKLAPMLFDDEEKELAESLRPSTCSGRPERAEGRESVVAPAERSPRARRKAASKRTDDGAPVHSFQTLLKDLATVNRNRVRPEGAGVEFDLLTTPTPLQRWAFELLGVSPAL